METQLTKNQVDALRLFESDYYLVRNQDGEYWVSTVKPRTKEGIFFYVVGDGVAIPMKSFDVLFGKFLEKSSFKNIRELLEQESKK